MRSRIVTVLLVLGVVAASGAAGLLYARQQLARRNGPLVITGTVQAATVDIIAAVGGRLRLVAVREGDSVKAGQLIAWLDAPELRSAAEDADRELSDVQRQMVDMSRSRSSRAPSESARAQAALRAAQRALEDAEDLIRQSDSLAQRVEAARLALHEAQAANREAEARVTEARAHAANSPLPPPAGQETGEPLESPSPSAAGTGEARPAAGSAVVKPVEDPELAAALDAAETARGRLRDAEAELAATERKKRDADAAPGQLEALRAEVQRTEAAVRDARVSDSVASGSDEENAAEDLLSREVRQAQVAASTARNRLKETIIVSPATGRVEAVAARRGENVVVGSRVATIRSLDAVWAEVTVPAESAGRVHRGLPVTATSDATARETLRGTVDDVSTRPEDPNGPVVVRVALTDPQGRLEPGLQVEVTFR